MTDKEIEHYAGLAGCSFNAMRYRLKHLLPDDAVKLGASNYKLVPDNNVYVYHGDFWTVKQLADYVGVNENTMRTRLVSHSVEYAVGMGRLK